MRSIHEQTIFLIISDSLLRKCGQTPAAGAIGSSLRAGASYAKTDPTLPEHASLVAEVGRWVGQIMAGLGLDEHALPPVWTADVALHEAGQGGEGWHVLKLDCNCIGIAGNTTSMDLRAAQIARWCIQCARPYRQEGSM